MAKSTRKLAPSKKQVSSKETSSTALAKTSTSTASSKPKKSSISKKKAIGKLIIESVRDSYNRAAKQRRYYERKGREELAKRLGKVEKQYESVLASTEKSGLDSINVDVGVTYEQKLKELEEREASIKERESYLKKRYDELKEKEEAISKTTVEPEK